jgi:hypothetical protein
LAVEHSEEWLTGRRYLSRRELKEHHHQEREVKRVALLKR